MKKLFNLTKTLLVVAAMLMGGANSVWAQDAGTYYIQNVGTGKWLGPANSWETQASVLDHADKWVLAKVSEGVYTLESVVSNGSGRIYLNGGYCDGETNNLTFAAIAEKENTYSIKEGTKYYTTGGTTVTASADDASSENAQWKLFSASDLTTAMASATPASGVDATWLILDHNLSRNNRNYSSWSNTGATAPKTSDKSESASSRYSIEAFQKTFDVHQSLTSIPNGVYGVQVNGFYRQDGSNTNLPYVYAGSNKTTIQSRGSGTENTMQTAAASFIAGDYLSNRAAALVTDGNLTVGIATEGTSCWTIFKNFHLTYYGNPTVANPLDMTSWIVNPGMEVDGACPDGTWKRDITGWSHNNTTGNYRSFAIPAENNTSGYFTNTYCAEMWNGSSLSGKKIYQVVTGLPNGVYKFQLAAMVAQGTATITNEFVYASSNGQTFTKTLSGTIGQSADYEVYAIVSDGTLEIGLDMNTSGCNWTCIDNARLSYYGASTEAYALVQPHSINAIPSSYALNNISGINPFDAGAITAGTNVTALNVSNTTATSYFDSDLSTSGNQPYVISDLEKVNVSFIAYHGWYNSGTSSIKVYNSDGEVLVGYTYAGGEDKTKVSDVIMGDATVPGFDAFVAQSTYNGSNGANGLSTKSGNTDNSFRTNTAYNLSVKMSFTADGKVFFTAKGGRNSVEINYSVSLSNKKMDLAKIVIEDTYNPSYGRSICISDLSITTETPTIPSLPTTKYTFDDDTTPFVGGSVVTGTVVGKLLQVNNTTATATFGAKSGKGWNYVPGAKETVTIEFDAYNGYLGSDKSSTFSVLNSDGVVLAGYTYNAQSGNITDVKIGGNTPAAFAAFTGRSRYGTNSSGNPLNANRHDGNSSDKPYQTTAGYNPHVTMTISGSGRVTFNFECSGYSIDKSYEAILDDVTIDLAQIRIVDNITSGRSSCFDNLVITTETEKVTTPTITTADSKDYFADTQTITLACGTAGASIYYTLDGTTPTSTSTLYSEPFEIDATKTVKVIAIKDEYVNSDVASATISKLYTQTNVTGKETWDWSVLTEGTSKLTDESTPKNTDEVVLRNNEIYFGYDIPSSFGDAQKLSVIGEYHFRNDANGKMFQGSTIKFTTEVPGLIDVDFSNTGNGNGDRYLQLNGENTAFFSGSTKTENATNISVAAGTVTLTSSEGYLRFYKIVFTPTLNTAGYSTFSSNENIQVTGANAYTAVLDYENETITCTKIADGKIPAGNGVILFGDGTEPVVFTTIGSAPALGKNNLKATTLADGSLASKGENTYYVLNGSTFKKYTGAAFGAGKAYFEVSGDEVLSRSFTMVFEDEPTGISDVRSNMEDVRDFYDLQGRRVAQPTKGLYIVSGKKVIVK
jgi:hypothetical protein